MCDYRQIIELIRKGDVILFIGSGFSIKAGAPSGSDLCDILYSALPSNIQDERSLKTEYTLQKLSETYATHFGREKLIDLLQKAFDFEAKDTSDQVQLACIPQFKHIITTNYDSLLEDAYAANCNLVVTTSDLSKTDSRKPTIYKIHGDFSHPENIVITKNDYNRLYSQQQETLIWDSIRVEFSRHNVLFIGYSISDQNIQILIENVKKQMGDSAKRLFVLTPEVEETALLQLKKLGVEYIQGKAEDLFIALIPELKQHILEDCLQKKTSLEDGAQFLQKYDLCAGFEIGGHNMPNKLLTIKSISGKAVHHTINFTLQGDGIGNPLDQIESYYDERFDNLPVKEITDFHSFEYRANDVVIKRGGNVASVLLVPIPKQGEISFVIPQKHLVVKSTCRYYNNWEQHVQVEADIDIGVLEILIPILPNKEYGFRFRQMDRYTDNSIAVAWENVFYALFSGCQFTLTLTSEEKISRDFTYAFKKSKFKQERKETKQALQYYKYIREIEIMAGACFHEYEKYSRDNLFAAQIVYHYLKKEQLIIHHPARRFEYTMEVQDYSIASEGKGELALIESIENVRCLLNGKEFLIPHMQQMYKQSVLKSIKRNESGSVTLHFIDKAKEHIIQVSDYPMRIETKDGTVEV